MAKLQPEQRVALHILARQYLGQRRTEQAEALLAFLVRDTPADPSLRAALAFALLTNGKPQSALEVLAAAQHSGLAAVHFLSAKALQQLGKMEEAERARARYRRLRRRMAAGG